MSEARKQFLTNTAYFLTIALLAFFAVKFLFGYFLPFIIAFIIAYFVQKPAQKFSEKTVLNQNVLSAILATVVFLLVFILLAVLIWIIIKNSNFWLKGFEKIFENITDIISGLKNGILKKIAQSNPQLEGALSGITEWFLENVTDRIASFLSGFAEGIVKKAPNFLFGALVTLVATFYISKDFEILKKFYINLFGKKIYNNTRKIKEIVISSVFKIAKGYLILLLITFTAFDAAVEWFLIYCASSIIWYKNCLSS